MQIPQPATKPTRPQARPPESASYLHGVVDGLLGLAMAIAQLIHQRTVARPETVVDATLSFERVARCIRRLVALAQRMAEPAPPPAALSASHDAAARTRTAGEAQGSLERAEGHERLERLERLDRLDELDQLDQLDAPEFAEDIGQPPAAIIADVCRELGLGTEWRTHPWERCTPEDIAALCDYAARPKAACRQALPKMTTPWALPPLSWSGHGPPSDPDPDPDPGPEPPS